MKGGLCPGAYRMLIRGVKGAYTPLYEGSYRGVWKLIQGLIGGLYRGVKGAYTLQECILLGAYTLGCIGDLFWVV